MSDAAADNDILYKVAWYGLATELLFALVPEAASDIVVLGQARFVVGKRLDRERRRRVPNADVAIERFGKLLTQVTAAEPSTAEQSLAAEFENTAQEHGVELDTGESLLCAMTIHRDFGCVATGDKRAICALEILANASGEVKKLAGKLVCLEQLFLTALANQDGSLIRAAVCAATHVDKAITICFSCLNPATTANEWRTGLSSYIAALKADAPTMLTTS